jgi:type I restriction-modification system DNA methylase subunit
MVGKAFETKLNVLLGRILSNDLGINATSEYLMRRDRPDIIIYLNGVKIILEGSYSEKDAKADIAKRIEEGIADIGIALLYKEQYSQNLTDSELEKALRESTFRVWLIVPRDMSDTLRTLFENKKIEPRWISDGMDVKIPDLVSVLSDAIQFIIREEDVVKSIERIEDRINEFVRRIKSIDREKEIAKRLYDIFYKLYGLSMGDYREIDELIYAKSALALLLSSTFYQSICVQKGLTELASLCRRHGYKQGLKRAFEEILEIDYRPIYTLAIQVVEAIPDLASPALKELVDLAEECSSKSTLLKKDFSGKIYHKIVGDWAVRKGFATYFTTVPAAYLLAYLTVFTRTGVFRSFSDSIKVGDLACGSGTLLTAAYNALRDLYIYTEFGKGGQIDLQKFHKTMLEKGIWGMDALRYAVQIASTNLALQDPLTAVDGMNMFAVPLGKEDERVLLGSLEFFKGKRMPEISIYFEEEGLKFMREAKEASITGGKIPAELPSFDLIIMNPPFTRPTGRGGKEGGGMFGFIPDKEVREELLKAHDGLRKSVLKELRSYPQISADLRWKLDLLSELDIKETFNIGQAGEGLLFLHLAYKHVKEDGKIAFVLPKSLLTGVSWFLARCLLLTKFHLEHIVVSYDPKNGYNFSESTELSEVLIVAKKRAQADRNEVTKITLLLRKPVTSMEARALAFGILSGEGFVDANGARAYTYTVSRRDLIEEIFNWGVLLAFPEPELSKLVAEVVRGRVFNSNIPMTELGKIAQMGIDRHQFHDAFAEARGGLGPYPAVYGGGEETRLRMLVKPNARITAKSNDVRAKCDELFSRFAGKLLIPDRLAVDTCHVVSMYCDEPVLSNIFYTVKLRESKQEQEKALCLWLNTTWGILTVLANRSETGGGWVQLKMTHWKLMPILDVAKLSDGLVSKLAEIFDKYCDEELRRLPEQFKPDDIDPIRKKIDTEFLNALGIRFREEELEKLYSMIYRNLKAWLS